MLSYYNMCCASLLCNLFQIDAKNMYFSLSLTKSTVKNNHWKFEVFTTVSAFFTNVIDKVPFQYTFQLCSNPVLEMVHDQLYHFVFKLKKVDQGNWFKCWF